MLTLTKFPVLPSLKEDVVTVIYAVVGIVAFVIAAGLIGYAVTSFLDKKYGTEKR